MTPDTVGTTHPGPITMVEPPECKMRYPTGWAKKSCEHECRNEWSCVARQQWQEMLEKVRAQ